MTMHKPAPRYAFAGRFLTVAVLIGASVGTGATVCAGPEAPISPQHLQEHLEQTKAAMGMVVRGGDLLDSLHFAWSDRPYARATMAVMLRSASVLKRELRLRRKGNGALPDDIVREILRWQRNAVTRARSSPVHAGFRPHRLRVTDAPWDRASGTPSLFGIVDAATATRHDRALGDLDLIASLGFRVYGWMDNRLYTSADRRIQRQRANALGMAVVRLLHQEGRDPPSPGFADESGLTIRPTMLADLLTDQPARPSKPQARAAIIDPPLGESWACRIARRALARGLNDHGRFVTAGWMPPTGATGRPPRAIETAMWLDAVDGQSLGLVRGWRDLRDGSAGLVPSLLPYPERMEVLAWTSLDLIRLGRAVAALRATPLLAVVVDREAVDPSDRNRWARWIGPVWAELLRRQIRYDVVRSGDDLDELLRRYRIVEPIRPDSARDPTMLVSSWEQRLADSEEHAGGVTAWESDGGPAREIVIREGTDEGRQRWLMIANLSDRPRRLQLRPAASLKQMFDLIGEETTPVDAGAAALAPWQVRILSSAR